MYSMGASITEIESRDWSHIFLLVCLDDTSIVNDGFQPLEQDPMQMGSLPMYSTFEILIVFWLFLNMQYFLPFGLDSINNHIKKAILDADAAGVKVLSLAALKKVMSQP